MDRFTATLEELALAYTAVGLYRVPTDVVLVVVVVGGGGGGVEIGVVAAFCNFVNGKSVCDCGCGCWWCWCC